MKVYDLLVRGGTVVTPEGSAPADVAVADGVIAALAPAIVGGARAEIDGTGLHVLPGVVDAHVHLNDPGRASWEGFGPGTRALAAGGATCFLDMPLNSHPPTLDGPSFDRKLEAARASAHVDFGLWGGLVPGDVDRLDELAARGVIGFKAFMCPSGMDDFPAADDDTLLTGMARAARLGLPVAVHAESAAVTAMLSARALSESRKAMRDFLRSRPVEAELEAIERALAIAVETGCSLHVVHVSTGAGVRLVSAARAEGADVTCETCPHYLALDDMDAERLGTVAKCAPPLRPAAVRDDLWSTVVGGAVDLVASDHSPSPPELKAGDDMFAAWGGIAGCQTLLRVMLTEGLHRGLGVEAIVRLACTSPATRFGLDGKGAIELGADADLVLVDLASEAPLAKDELLSRHTVSPFLGRRLRGRVVRTFVRGTAVYRDGVIVGSPSGRLVRPNMEGSWNRDWEVDMTEGQG